MKQCKWITLIVFLTMYVKANNELQKFIQSHIFAQDDREKFGKFYDSKIKQLKHCSDNQKSTQIEYWRQKGLAAVDVKYPLLKETADFFVTMGIYEEYKEKIARNHATIGKKLQSSGNYLIRSFKGFINNVKHKKIASRIVN